MNDCHLAVRQQLPLSVDIRSWCGCSIHHPCASCSATADGCLRVEFTGLLQIQDALNGFKWSEPKRRNEIQLGSFLHRSSTKTKAHLWQKQPHFAMDFKGTSSVALFTTRCVRHLAPGQMCCPASTVSKCKALWHTSTRERHSSPSKA